MLANADHEDGPPPRLPARQPGDALYRCTWCMEYRCLDYLQLCWECEAELALRRVGMPEEGRVR